MLPGLKKYMTNKNNPVDIVLVAGDNYYPDKTKNEAGKKQKRLNPDDLNAGFIALKDAVQSVQTHVIMGNHDLEKNMDSHPNEDCKITELEKMQSSVKVDLFKTIRWTDNTAIVMFDTSIYDTNALGEDIECYSKFDEPTEIIDKQEKSIMDFLDTEKTKDKLFTNLIMVGHYPIVSVKEKQKKGIDKTDTEFNMFSTFVRKICNHLGSDINYYYLCADVHLYQHGIVKLLNENGSDYTITQYVVGTGGAELDDIPKNLGPFTEDNIEYEIKESKKKNGFLVCEENEAGMLKIMFNETNCMPDAI